MKFLSSSPSFSSASSTTTTSFDPNMCSSKSATARCLAGILRRILCSGSLPTHPSDQIKEAASVEFDKDQEFKAKEMMIESAAETPGIVARLMGLESMPETNSKPNSISRSRSMNSADQLAGFDQMQGLHRRVKSTLSFRETPTFLEFDNENEKFLILSFENGGESRELRSKGRKSEIGFGELKQRSAERCKNRGNRTEKVSEKKKNNNKKVSSPPPPKDSIVKPHAASEEGVRTSKPINQKEVFNGGKLRKKKKKKKTSPCVVKKVESECSSEDSSPVSVLDFNHFLNDPEVPTSEENSRLADSKSRRKLSTELENYKQKSPRKDSNLIGEERKTKAVEGKHHGTKKKEYQSQNYMDMWGEILRLTRAELVGSNWAYRGMGKEEDCQGIGANFEEEILDQLVEELVGQLAGLA